MSTPKQVRITPAVDTMVDDLVEKLKTSDPFVKTRQDVVAKAIVELHKKELPDD